jgi:chromosomal replication initiation ATPase DnaA
VSEPRTLEEMNARKREADRRVWGAGRSFQAKRKASPPAPKFRPWDKEKATRLVNAVPEPQPKEEAEEDAEREAFERLVQLGRETLRNAKLITPPRRIIIEAIEGTGVTYNEVVGESRTGRVVAARYAAILAVRRAFPHKSLPWLGRVFDRDHSTILHALKKIGDKA